MSGPLVGREEELHHLELFLAGARQGPRALVIEGEAGAGKTSLWEAALQSAGQSGAHCLVARPAETEASFAYASLVDLLGTSREMLATLPARHRRALEVALQLSDEEVDAPEAHDVGRGFLGVIARLARERPVVIAVDDVQWLDAPSAAVLRFAARRFDPDPLGLLLSWRTTGGEPAPLGLDGARMGAALERLTVRPLSLGAVQRLLQQRLDHLPPRPILRRLYDLSGGNPFFALELGRALDAGTLRLEPGERLPVALDDLVGARLRGLAAHTRRALAAASALAAPTLELVEAVSGTAPSALDEAERADVVAVRNGGVRFTHPLLASSAYASVGASVRRALHLAASEHVSNPEERARHLALAASGPDESVAAALEAAGTRADARGAPPAAAELYERAAALTPQGAERDRLRRTHLAAFCTFRSGDGRRARRLLDDVVTELDPGSERAAALISLARVRSYDDDLRAAERLFRQALEEAGDDDRLRAAAGQNLAGILFRLRERLHEAVAHATIAAAAGEAAGDLASMAEALGGRVIAEAALGRRDSATATMKRALAVQERCRTMRALTQPLFQVGVVWLWWDELERAKDAFEVLLERAREMGDEGSLPYVLVLAAQVEAVRGDLARAAAHAEAGFELSEQIGQATLGAYLLALRAVVHADAGEAESCRAVGVQALELARRTAGRPGEHFAVAALGRIELSLGRAREAADILGPLVDFLRREQIREPGVARVVPDFIEARIALGELDEAEELLRWYARNAAELERASALAAASRCRGLLHGARGEIDAAVHELRLAVKAAPSVPVPLERGRSLLSLGAAERRVRRKRAARGSLEAAAKEFDAIGASVWAARARDELGRVGGRVAASGELTRAERRVAELVAEGLQTKQVAAALFVSPKTVEGHLTNIYAKLDVHSRTELARRLDAVG
jgi:DNA-binding CsgD family transcriptional regulator/tetratricopeptide (TPR) repeat protein